MSYIHKHLQQRNGDFCEEDDMKAFAARWDTYPLIDEDGPYRDVFTFQEGDVTDGGMYTAEYEVFPIGTDFRSYISAHVDVCEVGSTLTEAPTSRITKAPSPGPTSGPVVAPTGSPSASPTKSPTFAPS